MKKKKIPYGVSNYEKLINDNYYFVDKTKYIELIDNLNEPNIFFLRPRKFGKSLFISILQYYYGIEHKDKFNKMFGEYYIGKNKTENANNYFVLKFDFSGINTRSYDSTHIGFTNKILNGISGFNSAYNLFDTDEIKELRKFNEASEVLDAFFSLFASKQKENKIYIIIDEYDHFTNELISFRIDEFKNIVSKNGYVRKFYEVLKTGTGDGIVDSFFATGVTPVTLDSLTSGFNIASDKTSDYVFNEMLGFTDEEVGNMLEHYQIQNSHELLNDLRILYNGSLFNADAKNKLYNSNMVLFFLKEYIQNNKYPPRLIDTNIASDYSKIKNMFYINNSEEHRDKLNEIIQTGETSAIKTEKYTFEKEFTADDFVSLLFYNGMLTIKEPHLSKTVFQIPNYAIKEIYWTFFASIIEDTIKSHLNTNNITSALDDLALNNNMQGWILQIENVLTLLSNRDFQKFDEKYIKLLFITLASLSQLYIIKSEPEVEGEYPDLMYLFRKPYSPNYQFLIELKYLKIADKDKLDAKMEEAKKQVMHYIGKEEINEMTKLKAYAVVFVGDKGHFCEVKCRRNEKSLKVPFENTIV